MKTQTHNCWEDNRRNNIFEFGVFTEKETEGQTGVKGVSSNSLAETSERRGGACTGFSECVAVILN